MADKAKAKFATKSDKKEVSSAKISEHIARLAQPKRSSFVSEGIPDKEGIKKSTLKYKASKRIQSLAKPKSVNPKKLERDQLDVLTQAITTVSPSALIYKPTKRIVELAQPK